MKTLYALITKQCNLSCPHCDVKNNVKDNYNHEKFIEQVRNFDGSIVFFGGECTLYQNRLLSIAYDDIVSTKNKSISTNLTILNDDLINLFKDIKNIATSWNPHRFNDDEYQTWLENLNILSKNNIKVLVLITLTQDLIDIDPKDFMKIISSWNKDAISSIRFEQYIGDETTPDFFKDVDNWLCDTYNNWDSPIINSTPEYISRCYHDCSEVYTLNPDGSMVHGCPHTQTINVPLECYECERVEICKPCILQRYCSIPKNFLKLTTKVKDSK